MEGKIEMPLDIDSNNGCFADEDKPFVTIEEVYEAYCRTVKRKNVTDDLVNFEKDLFYNLTVLWYELNTKTYQISSSHVFVVEKPVKREVFAAILRDRIVHHILIKKVVPIFEEKCFIDDSYSCRKGKGTHFGGRKLREKLSILTENFTKEKVICVFDIRAFFMSIDKGKLWSLTEYVFKKYYKEYGITEKDLGYILYYFKLVIENNPQDDCIFCCPKSRWEGLPETKSMLHNDRRHGMPIGNLTSQFLANLFLSPFDHEMVKKPEVEFYGRYVDDFVFICDTTETAIKLRKWIETYIKDKLGLTLHPNKVYIQPARRGCKFIGVFHKKDHSSVIKRTKGSAFSNLHARTEEMKKRKIIRYNDVLNLCNSMNSYLGSFKQWNSYRIRKKLLTCRDFQIWKPFFDIADDYGKITLRPLYKKIIDNRYDILYRLNGTFYDGTF